MDVRISNGDIAALSSGSYEYICGIEEAVQRVRISALTVRGDFVYDRELGTDYSGIDSSDPLLCEKLLDIIERLKDRRSDPTLHAGRDSAVKAVKKSAEQWRQHKVKDDHCNSHDTPPRTMQNMTTITAVTAS